MAKASWWPKRLPDRRALMANFLAKIGGYAATLGLPAGLVTESETICTNWIAAYDWVEDVDATKRAAVSWRDNLWRGEPMGDPLPAAPVFAVIGAVTGEIGIEDRFFEIRDIITKSDGYTQAIGDDLMIEGAEEGPAPEAEIVPSLTLVVMPGYKINIKASLQGRDALQVEYKPNGGDWIVLKVLTKLPYDLVVVPQTPGQPESGHVRAIIIDENEPFGNYSPEYAVTLSA